VIHAVAYLLHVNEMLPGRLANIRVLTGSGTFTPSNGVKSIIVEVLGAGGRGGAATGNGSTYSLNSSGGAGGYAAKRWAINPNPQTFTYAVGAIADGNGGDSTFSDGTTTVTGGGGAGISSGNGGSGAQLNALVMAGSLGGVASNGDINVRGEQGHPSFCQGSGLNGWAGRGGSTIYGAGGDGGQDTANAGRGFGAGGSGSARVTASSAQGNGTGGTIVVWEYY
jgi:hypothetical protein